MTLYAISDPHLAFNSDKPMNVFGDKWDNHHDNIKNNWLNKITEEDTVLIAGDISWSMNINEGLEDLQFIQGLPGEKILVKGNHDYWWTSISKLNNLYHNMNFIQNNFFTYKDYAICGSRGWITPSSAKFDAHSKKIYDREIIRLRLSLSEAKKAGYDKIIVMMHYPPISKEDKDNGFIDCFKEFNVEKVIYGHLHGYGLQYAYEGIEDGIEYILTSCDYINFDPIKIMD